MKNRLKILQIFKDDQASAKHSFINNDSIVKKCAKESFIHVIDEGFVKVVEDKGDGKFRTILILRKGEIFPLIWGFDHPPATDYLYEAIGDVTSVSLPLKHFKEYLSRDIEFSSASVEMLTHITWDAFERIKGLLAPYTTEKLLSTLPYIAAKMGKPLGDKRYSIPKEMTQAEIAMLIGMTRESVLVHLKNNTLNALTKSSDDGRIIDLNHVPTQYIYQNWFED